MTTQSETQQIRLAHWKQVFQERMESGLSIKDCCALHDISENSYFYWLRMARKKALTSANTPTLVELVSPAYDPELTYENKENPVRESKVMVQINHATITITQDTSRDLLAMVLEVVNHVK